MKASELNNPALMAIREQRGLATKLAVLCSISRTAVWNWKRVPPRHAVKVARALNMPVHMVRPDVFPAPRKEKKQNSATQN